MSYSTPAKCIDELQRLHPANISDSHDRLYEMLNALSIAAPEPAEHLKFLEHCRGLLHRVQAELSREYVLQPLSPDNPSNTSLLRVVTLWRAMSHSYAQVTRNDASQGTLDDEKALLSQRRVYYAGQVVLEFFRARRSVPEQVWAELNKSIAMAEAQGIARVRVADTMNTIWHAQSPMQAYIATLLIDLANPAGRTAQQLNLICRWAQRFAPYCDLRPEESEKTPAKPNTYGISLNLNHGLRPISTLLPPNHNLRRFDGTKLAGQIRAVAEQLKSGEKPASLGLGEDCSPEVCMRLLLSLYRPWGLGSSGRKFSRRTCHGYAELSTDWLAIGFHISGENFRQPPAGIQPALTEQSLSTMFAAHPPATLDTDALLQRQLQADLNGFSSEHWLLMDQSVGGFRLQLRPNEPHLQHHQLVAVRPPDSPRFLLGQVSWMQYHDDGTLEAGVQVLNGLPQVIACRTANGPAVFQQGFWLPEIPALKQPATVVIPASWYPAHRTIQVYCNDQLRTLRLGKRLLAGHDFDQLSYEEITPAGV